MDIDQSLLYFFNQTLANPALDTVMWIATVWGLWLPLVIAIGYIALGYNEARDSTSRNRASATRASGYSASGYSSQGNIRIGVTLLIALAASFVLTLIFYYLALRLRPVGVRLIMPTPPFPSFPSGHATMAFGCATAWVLAMRQRAAGSSIATLPVIFAIGYLTALWIAVSRLYLGHHYPTDVLAGVVLGTSIGAAAYGIMTENSSWVSRLKWLLWPQVAIAVLVTMMAYLNILPIHLLHFPYMDKLLHFLLFGAVTFWLQLWWPNRHIGVGKLRMPLSILIPLAVALAEEGLQMLSPLRTASLADLGADAAGMLFFYLIAQKMIPILRSK